MKTILLIIFFHTVVFASVLFSEIKTLDFSDGTHSFSIFEKGGVELRPFEGIRFLRTIPPGTYKIILPGNIEFIIEAARGEVSNPLDGETEANALTLITDRLSLEAAKKLSYKFHELFELKSDGLDQWFEKLEAGEAYSAYDEGGLSYNFPFLAMSLRTTFGKEQPAFALFSISWREKFSKRSGRTFENNRELNVVYDMPKLLEGVPEFTEVEKVEPVIVKVSNSQSLVAQSSMSDEASADVKAVGIPKQPAENPSRWWLWLLGALIVIGGVAWLRQRKSNDSSE